MGNEKQGRSAIAGRLAHAAALLTSFLTLLLIMAGGLVTSLDVGMAVPDWPTTFEQNMITYYWFDAPLGVRIEHGHRLLGLCTGLAIVVAALLAWCSAGVSSIGWLALGCCVLCGLQGLLGGLRVLWNAPWGRELALIHGVSGQLFFACVMLLSDLTRGGWRPSVDVGFDTRRAAGWMSVGVLAQIVLGAVVRHQGIAFPIHLGGAALVLFLYGRLALEALALGRAPTEQCEWSAWTRGRVAVMGGLLGAQFVLGFAIWAIDGWPGGASSPSSIHGGVTAMAHVALGALLFSSVFGFTMLTTPRRSSVVSRAEEPVGMLVEVAR